MPDHAAICRNIRSTRCPPTSSARRPRSCGASSGVGERWRFASIELREPAKDAVRDFAAGDAIAREAVVVCWNRDDGQRLQARVVAHRATASLPGTTSPTASPT